jgi:hypothetical protein
MQRKLFRDSCHLLTGSMKIAILSFLLIVALCSVTTAQSDIHKIDFRNFSYSAYCAGDEPVKIHVRKGKFLNRSQDEYLDFEVQSVNYGDLDNDGRDEAVIITVCSTGGTGHFTEGFIYSLKNRSPVLVGRIAGGDRAAGGLASAKVSDGLLIVESNEEGGGGLCCPEYVVTNKFRLVDRKLVDYGNPTRRALYPASRVSFKTGNSNITFEQRIDERQRFVIRAKKGQTLYVTTNRPNSPVYIHTGDAKELENEKRLVATLNADGDFEFDVINNNGRKLNYSITVEIK